MANAQAEGDALCLSDEEVAFCDALTHPAAVKDFYQNEELVAMTRELADALRKNRTIERPEQDVVFDEFEHVQAITYFPFRTNSTISNQ